MQEVPARLFACSTLFTSDPNTHTVRALSVPPHSVLDTPMLSPHRILSLALAMLALLFSPGHALEEARGVHGGSLEPDCQGPRCANPAPDCIGPKCPTVATKSGAGSR